MIKLVEMFAPVEGAINTPKAHLDLYHSMNLELHNLDNQFLPDVLKTEYVDMEFDDSDSHFLIFDGDVAVGIVDFDFHIDVIYIEALYIKEEYRNKGYGTAAIKYIQEFVNAFFDFEEKRFIPISLGIRTGNVKAKGFYEHLGFKSYNENLILESYQDNNEIR